MRQASRLSQLGNPGSGGGMNVNTIVIVYPVMMLKYWVIVLSVPTLSNHERHFLHKYVTQ